MCLLCALRILCVWRFIWVIVLIHACVYVQVSLGCVCIRICICNVYEYVFVWAYDWRCARVCRVYVSCVLYMYTCVLECSVACYRDPDRCRRPGPDLNSFSLWTRYNGDSKTNLWGWSVDQYRFVQWRPDGDSVLKPRHFMWVFVHVYLPLSVFTCCSYHFM